MASADAPDDKPRYTQLRSGRWYWEPPLRLRRSHQLEVRALGADVANAWAYARKLNKELAGLDPDAAAPGTVTWLFEQFFRLPADAGAAEPPKPAGLIGRAETRFAKLKPSTQRDYRWLARVLGDVELGPRKLGRYEVRAIRPRHADRIYDLLLGQNGHATAHYACRVARRVWKWAIRQELADVNPWKEMELLSIQQRHQRWTPDQVATVVATAVEQKVASIGLAVLLAYWLGHRQGDVLTLTWTALKAEDRATGKTGARIPVVLAAYPELVSAVAAEQLRQDAGIASTHVVISEATGLVWNRYTFGHEFRRIANLAGLPADLQFRDLRATAATELADGGASVIEMSTHSGHKTVQMARRYARPTSEQFRAAAGKRLAARNKP